MKWENADLKGRPLQMKEATAQRPSARTKSGKELPAVAKSRANKAKKSNVAKKSKAVTVSNGKAQASSAAEAKGTPTQKANAEAQAINPAPAKIAAEQKANEAQIAVHWKEEDSLRPPASFIAQANLVDPVFVNEFRKEKFPDCFRHYAELLNWDKYWHTTLDSEHPPFWKWFVGGKLNVCYNCVDRHLADHKNKAAFIFVAEPEQEAPQVLTYRELYVRVNETAAMLQKFAGLKAGDRVTIHMPMIPELPISAFGGLWRLQRRGLRNARGGFRQPGVDLRRWVLAQRKMD